ncbi:MAG: hypothetical protein ACREUQ_06135, partial [Burkholderiales bacterium]
MGDINPLGGFGRLLRDITVYGLFILASAVAVYFLSELALSLGDVLEDTIFRALEVNLPVWAKPFRGIARGLWGLAPTALALAEAYPLPALGVAGCFFVVTWAMHRLARWSEWLACFLMAALGWFLFVWGMRSIARILAQVFPEPVALMSRWANLLARAAETYLRWLIGWVETGEPLALIAFVASALVLVLLLFILALVGSALWRVAMEVVRYVQNEVQGLIVGEVHPALPRRPEWLARRLAERRRASIDSFLASGKAPEVRREVRFAPGDVKNVRKHVDERTVEEKGPPKLVTAFLERPPASAITLERRIALEVGPEEAAGQYVRLNLERQRPEKRHLWLKFWGHERYEDLIVPLLGRAVDAAVLADRFFDEQRRETHWNALPFYERVWAEYRPIPFPFGCFFRPILGNGLPMRVIIETHYGEVFHRALFGSALRRAWIHQNWFGIGIQVEKPNQQQGFFSRLKRRYFGDQLPVRRERILWSGSTIALQCRRLKAHAMGMLNPRIDVSFSTPRLRLPPDPLPEDWTRPATPQPLVREDEFRLMPTTCLADGCPSVARPLN